MGPPVGHAGWPFHQWIVVGGATDYANFGMVQ